MKNIRIIWILSVALLITILVSVFLVFKLARNEKEEIVVKEFSLPEESELRLKYNLINRDDYPYYFSEGKKWTLDSSYGEVEIKSLSFFYEHNMKMDFDEHFRSTDTYLFFSSRPMIIDEFRAIAFDKIEFRDVDGDKKDELFVYYNTGTKERILQIYRVNLKTRLHNEEYIESFSRVDNLKLSSGSTQVEVDDEGYAVTTHHRFFDEEEGIGSEITTEKYLIKKDSFELISTEKKKHYIED